MIVVAVILISSKVLATGTSNSPIKIPTIDTTTNVTDDSTNTTNTTPTVIPTTNITTQTTNTTGSNYQNTTALPQTGDASDYAVFLLIVVAVIVAIYAYRKVKEYNIK